MSRFQRMVVIPHDEYAHLTGAQKMIYPYHQPYQQLQQQFDDCERIQDPYSRLLHETDALKQMRLIQDKVRSGLLATIPKVYKSRAESLLNVIEPHLKVNDRGELIEPVSGKVMENTRLDDLIQYAVGVKRRAFTPRGWYEFLRQLRKINVPTSILNRETIHELFSPDEEKKKKRSLDEEETRVKKKAKRSEALKRSLDAYGVTPKRVKTSPKGIKQKRKTKDTSRYPKDTFLRYY